MNIFTEYNKDKIYLKHAVTDFPSDNNFKMHIHDSFEIYFFVAGSVEYLIEGTSYPLRTGDLLFIRPSESHKPKILEATTYERYNINFPISLFESIDPEHRLLSPFLNRPLGQRNLYTQLDLEGIPIEKMFHDMCYFSGDSYDKKLNILSNILQILRVANASFCEKGDTPAKKTERASEIVAYINLHILDALNLPQLAKRFYLSQSQFNRIFKEATGTSPWSYILAKRLAIANEKIKSGMLTKSAAEECRFNDYSTFYRAYLKQFGRPPTDVKRS